MTKHFTERPEYWDTLARDLRRQADAERYRRRSIEHRRLYLRDAAEAEARAAKLRAAETETGH